MDNIKLFENFDLNESLDNTHDFLEVFLTDKFDSPDYELDSDEIRGTGKVAFAEVQMDPAEFAEVEKQIDTNYEMYIQDFKQAAAETLPDGESEVAVSTMDGNKVSFTIVYDPSFER